MLQELGHVMVQYADLVRAFGLPDQCRRHLRREWRVEVEGEVAMIHADDITRPLNRVACWTVCGFSQMALTRVAKVLRLTPLQVEVSPVKKPDEMKFLVRHFLQPDARGWPRAIDVFLDANSQVWLQPKRNRVNDEDGSLGVRSLPALVTPDEIFEAIKTAELYLDQVIKPEIESNGANGAGGAHGQK